MKKLLLTSFLILLASAISIAQTTTIPDADFEQALIDLGHDTAPIDGVVTTANISGLISLDVSNKNISDLTGIEDFTNLRFLECYSNNLTALNVTQNIALQVLYCYSNAITGILDVSNNTGLVIIDCWSNQITTLDVSLLTNLTDLHCGINQISTIIVSNAPNLERLTCNSNLLTTLDVTQNTNLIDLNYGNNQMIAAVVVTQNLVLEQYFCYENNLTNIDVSQNVALTNLGCYSNLLNEIDVSANTQLERLFSYDNPLTTNLNLSNNLLLERLWCFANDLTSLDISQNILIQSLQCGGGDQITTLDLSQHTALTFLNCGASQLTSLDLRNGTNTNVTSFSAGGNPNLTCIFVDDAIYSSANWTGIDAASTFVEDEAGCELLSIHDIELVNFSVYPNPATNVININALTQLTKVEIYSLLGTKVFETSKTKQIDISSLSAGVYIINAHTKNAKASAKIVIK